LYRLDNPLVVQGDRTVLLEVHAARYAEARDALCRFAELEKSPEHVHTYRLSPLSLWNAAAAGMAPDEVVETLAEYGKYPLPEHLATEIRETMARHGRISLLPGRDPQSILVRFGDELLARQARADRKVSELLGPAAGLLENEASLAQRGQIKRALIRMGFPAEDLVGFKQGAPLEVALRNETLGGQPFGLRAYQKEAAEIFWQDGAPSGGHGVVVLPCGAGKTVVGLATLALVRQQCLILVTNVTAARQWIREILDKTTLTEDQVGEYSGERKEIRPLTVATYQILTWRRDRKGAFEHFGIFNATDWGLIIHDEVHLLPAPVFRVTADLQACRRLGLTATLVREDGLEEEVFTLIGPKRYDVPWKELEKQGFIAEAACREVRVELPQAMRIEHAVAEARQKHRIASENPAKRDLVVKLAKHHASDRVLVIGQYLDQLEDVARDLGAPLITGRMPNSERDVLYDKFRTGEVPLLVVSKVANFAIDLPDANIAIQISGTFGSRQEEAQRLGRILRPKAGLAILYSLVTRDSVEQEFAQKRRLFLTEQGYHYEILDEHELLAKLEGGPSAACPAETVHPVETA
jgi:DNA excision repair protein ERCC-3